jgi:hypothetical protein
VALTAFAISPHYLARPHLFSFVMLLVWLIILLDAYDSGDFKPSIPVLVILIILWANLHGSFTLGIALLCVFSGYFCCEKFMKRDYGRCRSAIFMLLAVGVSALLTPYGVLSVLPTLGLFNAKVVLQQLDEFRSPDFQRYRPILFLFVGLFAAIAGLGVRLRGPRLIVFSMMLWMALEHTRGLWMFFLVAPIILARPLGERSVWWCATRPANSNFSESAAALDRIPRYFEMQPFMIPAICVGVATLATVYSWGYMNSGPPRSIAPKAAIDFVKQNGIAGNVFNSYDFGGYLIFSGVPTFIDGRGIAATDDFFWKYIQTVNLVDINKAFQLLDDYRVTWALLHPTQPLAKALGRSALWNEAYSDNYSVVFVRH